MSKLFRLLSLYITARQVHQIITEEVADGTLLPRTFISVFRALWREDGYAVVMWGTAIAYAECHTNKTFHSIHSVISKKGYNGWHLAMLALANRLQECQRRDNNKIVILACAPNLAGWYAKLGFEIQPKETAPRYIWGGRTAAEWASCNRIWMICTRSSYIKKRRQGTMARPNAFVKISGNLLDNIAVLEWLHELSRFYFVVVCIGGGEQINNAYKERGLPIKFCPLGRITRSLEERQIARDILEENQAIIQDLLDVNDVNARVIVPVEEIGGVLCHINGDIMMLASYLGYDKLFILTTKDRVDKKKLWLKQVAEVFTVIEKGTLDKVEVIGF
jgi:hypothetical protein